MLLPRRKRRGRGGSVVTRHDHAACSIRAAGPQQLATSHENVCRAREDRAGRQLVVSLRERGGRRQHGAAWLIGTIEHGEPSRSGVRAAAVQMSPLRWSRFAPVLFLCAAVGDDAGEPAASGSVYTIAVMGTASEDDGSMASEEYERIVGEKVWVSTLTGAARALAAEPAASAETVEVRLAPGVHKLLSTLQLGPQHGSNELRQSVVFLPLDPQSPPVISGGAKLTWEASTARVISNGRSASQSTTQTGGLHSNEASRAVDGNTNGDRSSQAGTVDGGTCTQTTPSDPSPWWQLDLGRVVEIERIDIYHQTDQNQDSAVGGRVLVSNSSDFSANEATLCEVLDEPGAAPEQVQCHGTLGKYVTVDLSDKPYTNLTLCEVKVFARSWTTSISGVHDLLSVQLWRDDQRMLVVSGGSWVSYNGTDSQGEQIQMQDFVPEYDTLHLVASSYNTHERRLVMWRCTQHLQHVTRDVGGRFSSLSSRPIVTPCPEIHGPNTDGAHMCFKNTSIEAHAKTPTIVYEASSLGDALMPFFEGYADAAHDCDVSTTDRKFELISYRQPSAVYTLGTLGTLVTIEGTVLANAHAIRFQDIDFEHTSVVSDEVIDSRGASIHAMIRVQHAQQIQFIRCGLRHAGGHGLWVGNEIAMERSGVSMLQACEFEDLGASILRQDFVSSHVASQESACGLEIGEWGSRLLGPQVINY